MDGLNWMAHGEGPGILFVHGAGGDAAAWWQQMEAFAATHRVAAYDLAGFGRSRPMVPDEAPACLSRHAAEVLDAAGIERATVVCQSLGGWTGVRLALERPERVERLVLCATMGGIAHMPALKSYMESAGRMDARGPASLALGEAFEAAHPAKAYVYRQLSAYNPPLRREAVTKLFSADCLVPPERLAEIACPVLLILGEDDPIWPPAALEGLVKAFPQARMEVIPGTGHSAYFEKPDVFNRILAEAMV